MDELRYSIGGSGNGGGFNSLAAGNKLYGAGRTNPTMGPVDKLGYINRDATIRARRNAILRRLMSSHPGEYLQPGSMR